MTPKRILEKQLAVALDALEFYANPETYFAIMFLCDPPAGDFAKDTGPTDLGVKPGKKARRAIRKIVAIPRLAKAKGSP